MASSAKSSSEDRKIQQQSVDSSSGSVSTSDGQWRNARVSVMKRTKINICDDVWYEAFGWSTRAELGLKVAPICHRFDGLADGQLGSIRRQWTLGRIKIRRAENGSAEIIKYHQKDSGVLLETSALLDVPPPSNLVGFNKIRIKYVDQNVIAFLRRIRHLFNTADITLKLPFLRTNEQLGTFVGTHLWPLIAQNVYKLVNFGGLRILFSSAPAILRDCANLRMIHTKYYFPETTAADRADASHRQALNKWLHTPRSDGLPKVVTCKRAIDLAKGLAGLKITFVSTELPVSYLICVKDFYFEGQSFELKNQRTRERMTFRQALEGTHGYSVWLLNRGPTIWWDENKWAEIERKAKKEAFGHWSDEKNLIYCANDMTFGGDFV